MPASPPGDAPAPMLPALPPDRLDVTTIERLVADRPRTGSDAPPPRSDASPDTTPEITIHIGRLDIRADTPRPAAAPAASAPALPSLSDYLRGRQR